MRELFFKINNPIPLKNKKIRIVVNQLVFIIIALLLLFFPFFITEKKSERDHLAFYFNDSVVNKIDFKEITSQLEKYKIKLESTCYVFLPSSRKEYRLLNYYIDKNSLGKNYLFLNRIIITPDLPQTRSVTKIIIHEIGHTYLKQKYGYFKSLRMPKWKQEGFCDYISESSTLTDNEGYAMLLNKKNQNTENVQFEYFKYRLIFRYLIERKHMKILDIIETDIDIKSIEDEIVKELTAHNKRSAKKLGLSGFARFSHAGKFVIVIRSRPRNSATFYSLNREGNSISRSVQNIFIK